MISFDWFFHSDFCSLLRLGLVNISAFWSLEPLWLWITIHDADAFRHVCMTHCSVLWYFRNLYVWIGQIKFKSCFYPHILFKSCSNPVQILFKSCSNPVQILFKSCSNPVHFLLIPWSYLIQSLFLFPSYSDFVQRWCGVQLNPLLAASCDWIQRTFAKY
jgi:hypothetical protein